MLEIEIFVRHHTGLEIASDRDSVFHVKEFQTSSTQKKLTFYELQQLPTKL
jgi:hypothetical protein